ncbi:MAG: hypothetical protein UZ15_CFX003000937 [Chloroflexi bacterium OLB15]|nr:MAG: hypothetical protein UZ15_CFX003000937 [Chloroflexi bacterium OLB15]
MNIKPHETEARSGAELEYLTLREEALRRSEQRQSLLSITVTLAAAFLGIGWGTGGAVALMIFPPMAALLALVWAQNEVHVHRINVYIREQLSQRVPGLIWEQYRREDMMRHRIGKFPLDILAVGGVFIGAQILAVVLAVFRFETYDLVQWVLLIADIGSILLLLWTLNYLRRLITQ